MLYYSPLKLYGEKREKTRDNRAVFKQKGINFLQGDGLRGVWEGVFA